MSSDPVNGSTPPDPGNRPDDPTSAIAKIKNAESLAVPGPTPIIYPPLRLDANLVHADLREASTAAWRLVFWTWHVKFILQQATGQFSKPRERIYNQGTTEERIETLPPIYAVSPEEIVHAVDEMDEARLEAEEKIAPVRHELIDINELYSDGDIHAACAHDAALTHANETRRQISFTCRIAARDYTAFERAEASGGEEVPTRLIRDHWEAFLREFELGRHTVFEHSTRNRLEELLKREAVKTANARHRERKLDRPEWEGPLPTQQMGSCLGWDAPSIAKRELEALENEKKALRQGSTQKPLWKVDGRFLSEQQVVAIRSEVSKGPVGRALMKKPPPQSMEAEPPPSDP